MQGDVLGLIAFDLVLRVLFARVMGVAFVIDVFDVHAHDFAADPAGLRIPTDMIADFKPLSHDKRPWQTSLNRKVHVLLLSACDENIGASAGVPTIHPSCFWSATAQAKQKTGCMADN
jgi:hypothetical protein